ncbi:MAG: hypothetical protein J7L23_03870 [Candidatus Diapherotrites archaeon]|nr:hypothetical protein [Candidatus Diapherotrites archaeon]
MSQIVCDSSSIISLSENCLLNLLPRFKVDFVVPRSVEKELVDKPLRVDEFEFKALRLREAINEGIIQVKDVPGVHKRAEQILAEANSLFTPRIKILHEGEAECMAMLELTDVNTLLVDERTTRLIIEDIIALGNFIQSRASFKLRMDREKAMALQERFSDVTVLRSTELIAVAYEKGLLNNLGDGHLLHASLYALKYSGCAITKGEIKEYLQLLK